MQCPNCNAPIFENDRFCGECGTDVSAVTMEQTATQTESKINTEDGQKTESKTAAQQKSNNAGTYFTLVLSFIKNAFVKPGTIIGSGKVYAPSVTAGTVGMATLIVSLLFFIMTRSFAGPYAEVPFGIFVRVFFTMAVLIAVFYGVTMLMNALLLKTAVSWQQILHDFSVSTIIVLGMYTVAVLFSAITLVEIGLLFFVIGSLLFITAPIYIFLRYAGNNNVKFDSYYSLVIYFVINAIVYYILVRIAVAQSMSELERLLMF